MKSEKGVTLISIVVYIIGIMIVIAILSGLSNFFFQNKNELLDQSRYISEYNKFNMYFINDIKNNRTAEIETIYQQEKDENGHNVDVIVDGNKVEAGMRIILADGTVYTYRKITDKASNGTQQNDYGIYRNRAKICSGIVDCSFKIVPESNQKDITEGPYKGKRIITVQMTIDEVTDNEVTTGEDITYEFTTTNNYVLKYW